jgi:methylglyoxal synthase
MPANYPSAMVAMHPFTLALIAHDGKKDDVLRFAREHLDELRPLYLIATATTGSLLRSELGLDVQTMASGPQGGDLQIGARIVEGRIEVCDVHDVPLATNRASALLLIRSLDDELRA